MSIDRMGIDPQIYALAEQLIDDSEPVTDAERAKNTRHLAEMLQVAFENAMDDIANGGA